MLPHERAQIGALMTAVQGALTDELRIRRWQGHPNPVAGHCYTASEALFHLGARALGFRPFNVQHEHTSHWCLVNDAGTVVDPTVAQFVTMPDYSKGRRRGFQTGYERPSKRAQAIIDRVLSNGATERLGEG